jgi:hypothetical protein
MLGDAREAYAKAIPGSLKSGNTEGSGRVMDLFMLRGVEPE